MKLVRYGNEGREKPGLIDADGQLRDLSGHVLISMVRPVKGQSENALRH